MRQQQSGGTRSCTLVCAHPLRSPPRLHAEPISRTGHDRLDRVSAKLLVAKGFRSPTRSPCNAGDTDADYGHPSARFSKTSSAARPSRAARGLMVVFPSRSPFAGRAPGLVGRDQHFARGSDSVTPALHEWIVECGTFPTLGADWKDRSGAEWERFRVAVLQKEEALGLALGRSEECTACSLQDCAQRKTPCKRVGRLAATSGGAVVQTVASGGASYCRTAQCCHK